MTALEQFESLVLSQTPAAKPWEPVTDYSFEARKAIEGPHAQLIKDVFRPKRVLDVGCGPGHLVRMLKEIGVKARGVDKHPTNVRNYLDLEWCDCEDVIPIDRYDLVICREVLEHLTLRQIRRAVTTLCQIPKRFLYITTRFAKNPTHLLHVDTSDDLDPTHISMMNQDFLRVLFVLEGFKRRPDLEERMDHMKKGRVLVYERAA